MSAFRIVMVLSLSLMPLSCAFSAQSLLNLPKDITQEEVIRRLGVPVKIEEAPAPGFKALVYWFPRNPFTGGKLFPKQLPYWVVVENGKVIQAGKTEIAYVLKK